MVYSELNLTTVSSNLESLLTAENESVLLELSNLYFLLCSLSCDHNCNNAIVIGCILKCNNLKAS